MNDTVTIQKERPVSHHSRFTEGNAEAQRSKPTFPRTTAELGQT